MLDDVAGGSPCTLGQVRVVLVVDAAAAVATGAARSVLVVAVALGTELPAASTAMMRNV